MGTQIIGKFSPLFPSRVHFAPYFGHPIVRHAIPKSAIGLYRI